MHQCVSLMAGAAVLLHSLALLLIMAGDVELNPGPGMGESITLYSSYSSPNVILFVQTLNLQSKTCL